MDNKEAINIIERQLNKKYLKGYKNIQIAKDMAMSALEKQIPKKLEIRNATDDDIESELRDFITTQGKLCRCSDCKEIICVSGIKYCWYCGQKLDWSDL